MIKIKTEQEINKMRASGHLNYLAREYIKTLIVPGVTTGEIDKKADEFIRKNGGISSFKDYEGFPGSICISINEEVVHGIPGDRVIKNGDIVSIDVGVIFDGFHSDAAETVAVGVINKEKSYLIKHTENSLYAGLKEIKSGAKLGNVSARIEGYAKKHNLGVVRELVGHGVGVDLHEEPDVPNYGKYNTGIILKSGMTLAIEPMLTSGKRNIRVLMDDWTIVTQDGKPSAHFEHTILVTDDGYEILTGE